MSLWQLMKFVKDLFFNMAVVEVVAVECKVLYLYIVGILLQVHGMNNLVHQHIVENVMKYQNHKQNMRCKGSMDT